MKISKKAEGSTLTIAVDGRIDTTTTPELEKEIKSSLDGFMDLVFDFTGLEYISSSGLRALLFALKAMQKQGGNMTVTNCGDFILEIFAVTGFSKLLTVK